MTDTRKNLNSIAYENSKVIKPKKGTLFGFLGYNSKTAEQFIQIFDFTSVPADSSIPTLFFKVAGSSSFAIDFGEVGRDFKNGIVICNSTTGPTKTIGAADCWFDIQYL